MKHELRASAHRSILKATAVIGGASAVNILIGLARNKLAALMLGPVGIGSIGLLLNIVLTAANLGGLGVAMASVRTLASATGADGGGEARRALTLLTISLAITGAVATWLLRAPIARYTLSDATEAWRVGWLAPAVALTIWSGAQLALLNGLGRLAAVARVQVVGAALGTALGLAALALWGADGVLGYVIAAPVGMVIAGWTCTSRLPRIARPVAPSAVRANMVAYVRLGIPMMFGAITLPFGLLAIRALTADHLGGVALGQFTAAWTLSVTYVSFVLAAMSTDYFPKLSAIADDHAAATRLVNDHAQVALLLSLPVMLAVQAIAPWLITLLYSDSFTGAVTMLRWQIAGDVVKIISWPLAFVLLAQQRGIAYWLVESSIVLALVSSSFVLIPRFGIAGIGASYLIGYIVYLFLLLFLLAKRIGFSLSRTNIALAAFSLFAIAVVGAAGAWSPRSGFGVGAGLLLVTSLFGYRYLLTLYRSR